MHEVFGDLRAAAAVRAAAHVRAVGTEGSDPVFRVFRSPIFWLAVVLLAASIAGCIVTVMLALGQPDGALPDVGERLLSVPAAHAEIGR